MLSRVANSLFWLGRYAERAENYARFIDVNINLMLDLPPGMKEQWKPLVKTTGDYEHYLSKHKDFSRESAIHFLAFDRENANSIISSIQFARENARIVRENLANETWQNLNDLYHYVNNSLKRKVWLKEDASKFFQKVKQGVQLLYGLSYNTAPRMQGWYFSQIGQLLERADKTSRILDVKYHTLLPSVEEVGSPLDFLHWAALLKSVSGFNAYRKCYGKIEPASIVEYLVLDKYFPRSILYCLTTAELNLHEISGSAGRSGYSNPAEKALGNLRSQLEFADVNDVINFGLHEYMDQLQAKLNEISGAIHNQYFKIRPNFMAQNQTQ